jgi:hypothetical protein
VQFPTLEILLIRVTVQMFYSYLKHCRKLRRWRIKTPTFLKLIDISNYSFWFWNIEEKVLGFSSNKDSDDVNDEVYLQNASDEEEFHFSPSSLPNFQFRSNIQNYPP